MIYDSLINFKNYIYVHPLFLKASDFLNNNESLEPGKYQIGNGISANINIYETKNISDCFIECHDKYIDVQILLEGSEKIGFLNRSECEHLSDYDESKDLIKLKGCPNFISLKPGYFGIFFPHDAHMPQLKNLKSETVKKLVIKIPVLS